MHPYRAGCTQSAPLGRNCLHTRQPQSLGHRRSCPHKSAVAHRDAVASTPPGGEARAHRNARERHIRTGTKIHACAARSTRLAHLVEPTVANIGDLYTNSAPEQIILFGNGLVDPRPWTGGGLR